MNFGVFPKFLSHARNAPWRTQRGKCGENRYSYTSRSTRYRYLLFGGFLPVVPLAIFMKTDMRPSINHTWGVAWPA